jgi:hypothetical protein
MFTSLAYSLKKSTDYGNHPWFAQTKEWDAWSASNSSSADRNLIKKDFR